MNQASRTEHFLEPTYNILQCYVWMCVCLCACMYVCM